MSMIQRFFQLDANKTDVKTEVLAGITTFIAGMYIIIVNPAILADAGIPYSAGLTATVCLSAVTTIAMGIYAKNPILVAPGMGINAYFSYMVVKGIGVDPYIALGAIFWAGIIFILLSVFNIRVMIIKAIPASIRLAGAVGIGLFIALIGFSNSGFIVAKTPLIGVGEMNAVTITFLLGLAVMIILVVKGVRGAFVSGMLLITLMAWPIGRWYGDASAVHHGVKTLISWDGMYSAPDFSWFFTLRIWEALKFSYIPVVFTLLFVDMFDSITTFVGVAEAGNLKDKNGDPRNIKQSMIVDGFATLLAGVFGSSPGTAYIESAAGIEEGGRTGLTAVVAGLLFIPFIFFAPLAAMVPSIATAPVLILVGVFMAGPINKIKWNDIDEAIPAFLTVLLIPITYSLTQGLIYGLLSYTLIKLVRGKAKEIPLMLFLIDLFALPMLAIEYGLF
jgi:AGZA family xanthine/uracil permease-like MFS transporter